MPLHNRLLGALAVSDEFLAIRSRAVPETAAVNVDTAASDAEPRCQLCGAPGRMTLLTSMTRYYACERCQGRWHIARLGDEIGPTLNRHELATPNV